MLTMDIFDEDAFSLIELTMAFKKLPYKPSLIRSLGLFEFEPITSKTFAIEESDGVLSLIPFVADNADPSIDGDDDERTLRDFRTRRLFEKSRIQASAISGLREFGTTNVLQQVQGIVARKALDKRIKLELTYEFHMLNALDGLVLNPKTGATVYDWYQQFEITRAAIFDFDLDNSAAAKGELKKKCETVKHMMEDGVGDVPGTIQIEAVCGRNFWKDLTCNPEVIDAYNHAAALAKVSKLEPDVFEWGDITWRYYRPGSSVSIPTDECRIYIKGVPGMFKQFAAPIDTMGLLGTPGEEAYYRIIRDRDRDQWADVEIEAQAMFVNTRPGGALRGKRT